MKSDNYFQQITNITQNSNKHSLHFTTKTVYIKNQHVKIIKAKIKNKNFYTILATEHQPHRMTLKI